MNFFSLFKRKIIYKFKKKINVDFNKDRNLSLENLFIKYGSDKASIYKDNLKGHVYTKFYLKELKKFKNKKINILEIGSLEGSSAVAFSKYFKNSKVYCFDVNISIFKYISNKIEVFGIDATKEKKVDQILNKILSKNNFFFDLIIDDGSHKLDDILIFFKIFFKYLKKNGYYVIEEFNFPEYYKHLNVIGEPKINKFLISVQRKKFISSKILNRKFQEYIFKNIKYIKTYKGNNWDSDIVFLKKN